MKKLIFAGLLFLLSSTPSLGQSINEKLAPSLPRIPGVICIKDQCNDIHYLSFNYGNHVLLAWTVLHGQTYYGWRPVCLSCSYEEESIEAAHALKEHIRFRFPDAETGYVFQQIYRQ